jgi:formate dehydrogenase iron-sulfur subunit
VDLDKCSGCKACVSACHSLNGLDEDETWRNVGLLVGGDALHEPCRSRREEAHYSPRNDQSLLTSAPTIHGSNARPELEIEAFQQHVTTACHHCVDPACLNGCPVLAYEKDRVTGIVRHLDDQCIGCSYCVMKCPYEVPRYSTQRGIVRKCDMCSERLAVGEAPACVQACPSEAIRIEIVEQGSVREDFRGASAAAGGSIGNGNGEVGNSFLPDSPDPRITLPTTRYVSRRPLAQNVLAADHGALRLDAPHWPLVVMLVLTQGGAGMFLSAAVAGLCGLGAGLRALELAGLGLCCAGLAASVSHLGQPLKAWRAFLGWRKSWLSREIIALNLFAGLAAVAVLVKFLEPGGAGPAGDASGMLAALAGLVGVFASAMVYVDTRRPFWEPRFAFGNFFGTTLVLGASFAAAMFGWVGGSRAAMQLSMFGALVVHTVLFCWRQWELDTALGDSQSRLHFNARVICELLRWTSAARTWLFVASMLFGSMAIGNALGLAPCWASLAGLAILSSEIIARYVFFAAGGSKRMPGAVAA